MRQEENVIVFVCGQGVFPVGVLVYYMFLLERSFCRKLEYFSCCVCVYMINFCMCNLVKCNCMFAFACMYFYVTLLLL